MGTTYRCLIIDDEEPAHRVLISHISKFDFLEHTASAYHSKDALRMLSKNEYDVIFLDINMPVMTGVELMELQPKRPLTIITTAYSDFALTAFKQDAIDYLLKPISLQDFAKAIEKLKVYSTGYKLAEEMANVNKNRSLSLKVDGVIKSFALVDIICIESFGHYFKLHLDNNKKTFVVYGTLLNLVKEIENSSFIRVHRSYIVNSGKIANYKENLLTLTNNMIVPVGRKYKILLDKL